MKRKLVFMAVLVLIALLTGCSFDLDGKTSLKKLFDDGGLKLVIKQAEDVAPEVYKVVAKSSDGKETVKEIERSDNEHIELTLELEAGTYDISINGYFCIHVISTGEKKSFVYDGKSGTLEITLSKTAEADDAKHEGLSYESLDGFKHKWSCSECGKSGEDAHTFSNWESDTGHNGHFKRDCTVCNLYHESTFEWGHHDKVEATCGAEGSKEYWKCPVHENEYLIKDGTAVIGEEQWKRDVVIDKTNDHSWNTGTNYSFDDEYHWYECSVCHAVQENSKREHTWEQPTCTYSSETHTYSFETKCSTCKHTAAVKSGGFDVAVVNGNIKAERIGDGKWSLSTELGTGETCSWVVNGSLERTEEHNTITVEFKTGGKMSVVVLCNIYDEKKSIKDIAMAMLSME